MEKVEIQANVLLFLMFKSIEILSEIDEGLQEDIENLEGSVQWNIGESNGYQIFENGSYKHQINAEIENPKVKLEMSADVYTKLFNGELDAASSYMAGQISITGDMTFVMAISSLSEYLREYMEQ